MDHSYTYLRLSITDQCNFNCFYCQPALRRHFLKDTDYLSFDEAFALASRLVACGIRHVRLTGGEPLQRPQVASFAKRLSAIPGLEFLSLTTNGYGLSRALGGLKEGGVSKINISLDTLKRDRFKRLTGKDVFFKVKEAVVKAAHSGFRHVKLNCIVMKGFNDDEILDFVEFGSKYSLDVRFIEFFPTHGRCDSLKQIFFPSSAVKKIISDAYGRLESLGSDPFCGPAQYFKTRHESGRIGFISSVTDFFCGACNRLRLTADGKLYPCLHSDHCADLKEPLRASDGATLARLIEGAIADKKIFNKAQCSRAFEMSSIGG
ncbi:MAG: GTP 3',8-cyclase MoaA [Candidatus Omnitrophota bacterium]